MKEAGGRERSSRTCSRWAEGSDMKKKDGRPRPSICVCRRAGMKPLEETELAPTGIFTTTGVMGCGGNFQPTFLKGWCICYRNGNYGN